MIHLLIRFTIIVSLQNTLTMNYCNPHILYKRCCVHDIFVRASPI